MNNKKIALLILDGWGIGDKSKADVIHNANTPFMDSLLEKRPHSVLRTDGKNVGLPEGQMGNSEVGHLNLGAGRIVYQDLLKINNAVEDGSIENNPVLIDAFDYARENQCKVHFMGLVSDGGIHSHEKHLYKLCDMAKDNDLDEVYVHAFTDGRDTDPKSGIGHVAKLQEHLAHSAGELVSVIGRYYAMDRDKRWERIKEAYDLLLKGEGKQTEDLQTAVQESYDANITDEFIKPIVKVDKENRPIGRIEENDVVVCFNFRTDRCRQITQALTQQDFPDYEMKTIPLYFVTMTRYDKTFQNIHVVFPKENIKMTLGEVLALNGKTQIRIAETEKYPHVTYFFSGGREKVFEGEKRIMINSPKVPTYDFKPEMSAYEVTEAIVKELDQESADFICLNFANPDMVGHTGVYDAIVKAVETTDECTGKVVEAGLKKNYSFIIISDHGNADYALNDDGSPNTAHTKNPVPCVLIDEDFKKVKNGILADIAPTILKMMEIDIPEEMTGSVLVEEPVKVKG